MGVKLFERWGRIMATVGRGIVFQENIANCFKAERAGPWESSCLPRRMQHVIPFAPSTSRGEVGLDREMSATRNPVEGVEAHSLHK